MASLLSPTACSNSNRESFRHSFCLFLMGASHPDQINRPKNIAAVPDPETDPARARKEMVRRGMALPHQRIAIRPPHKTIQQTVAMYVAAFLSAKNEPDPAEVMHPRPHAGHFIGPLF